MATAAKPETEILPPETAGTDIMLAVEASPQIVLLDRAKFDQFFDRVKAETQSLQVDLSTKKGRDEVRSMAAKVTKSKAMIDKARLALTSGWRQQVEDVNAAGKEIVTALDALADETRKPLTDWEEADKTRIAACTATMEGFRTKALVTLDDTADTVRARGEAIYLTAIDPTEFQDLAEKAEALKQGAIGTLFAALQRLEREEKERAELAQLRKEKEERDAADAARIAKETAEREAREKAEREATEAREAGERAARQARDYAMRIMEHIRQVGLGMIDGKTYPYIILIRELEEKVEIDASFGDLEQPARNLLAETLQRVKDAQTEQNERSIREAAEAAAAEATRAAEAAAQLKREQEAAAAQAEIDAANRRAAEAEIAAQAERDRANAAEVDRQAVLAAEAAEQKRRDEDQAHRTEVKAKAKLAIMSCGADEETARKIIMAIRAGEIPHVTLSF